MQSNVDNYFIEGCLRCPLGATSKCKVRLWTEPLENLRQIVLDCGLKETIKWGSPCYTYNDKNVLLLTAFKQFCAIGFFKGVLLKDPNKMLKSPGDNSQSTRVLRFTTVDDIEKNKAHISAYIQEAIAIEKAGLKVPFKKTRDPLPEELERKFEEDPVLKNAFEALTPGRQRGYILFFSQPKQSKTRISRIENSKEKIFNGVGLHDYKK